MAFRIAIAVLGLLAITTPAAAQSNLNKAKGTVDNIRPADPPSVSTGTVVQPIQRPPQQMPSGGSDVTRMRTNPPPSPPTKK
jgi:hypothetical protein